MNTKAKKIVCGFDNLYKAMNKCKIGVAWKKPVARYANNGIVSVHKTRKELLTDKRKIRPYNIFTIHEPKKREIVSTHFEDRIVQTSISDNYLYDKLTRNFVYDNHACQIGKGTDLARERLKTHMQRYFRKHGLNGYVLNIDFKDYFGSTRHDIAKESVRKNVDDEWVLMNIDMIVDSFNHGDDPNVGMGLGSPITQLIQLALPNTIDHLIKEKLKIKTFLRYMDDNIFIHHSKNYLIYCLNFIREKLEPLGIALNTTKTQIYKLIQGIKFLGFTFKLTETGKVLMLLNKNNIRRRKRKIKKHKELLDRGKMTEEQVEQSFEGWKAHAEKGNNYHIIQKMTRYYRRVMLCSEN